ncbi:MAG TPA: potassium-transporting ATPase subunit KdpC, partial [Bacteroidota bacterium]|nr:potassium-transporting ATPase subunit KdpC [Bacteroidota bacterium]
IKMFFLLTVLTGAIYPLLITGIGSALFPAQAAGSIIERMNAPIGSLLIGQKFANPKYFWPRPSTIDYNPLPSNGSNYGPTSDTLRKQVLSREKDFRQQNFLAAGESIPPEMLTASASGLDPHISPTAALLQIGRVALARKYDQEQSLRLQTLIDRYTERPDFGLLGEPRVNVLLLNVALDSLR